MSEATNPIFDAPSTKTWAELIEQDPEHFLNMIRVVASGQLLKDGGVTSVTLYLHREGHPSLTIGMNTVDPDEDEADEDDDDLIPVDHDDDPDV